MRQINFSQPIHDTVSINYPSTILYKIWESFSEDFKLHQIITIKTGQLWNLFTASVPNEGVHIITALLILSEHLNTSTEHWKWCQGSLITEDIFQYENNWKIMQIRDEVKGKRKLENGKKPTPELTAWGRRKRKFRKKKIFIIKKKEEWALKF